MPASTIGSTRPVFTLVTRDTIDATASPSPARVLLLRIGKLFSIDAEQRDRERQEACLARSADRYELEYHMREFDRAAPGPYWLTGLGR
jgi:hypothetical protein